MRLEADAGLGPLTQEVVEGLVTLILVAVEPLELVPLKLGAGDALGLLVHVVGEDLVAWIPGELVALTQEAAGDLVVWVAAAEQREPVVLAAAEVGVGTVAAVGQLLSGLELETLVSVVVAAPAGRFVDLELAQAARARLWRLVAALASAVLEGVV